MSAIKDRSQAIGEFLEWLEEEKGWEIAERHTHTDYCYTMGLDPDEFRKTYGPKGNGIAEPHEVSKGRFGNSQCGISGLWRVSFSANKLLAEFFDIDLNKIESEKRAMLNELRQANHG